jgi:energy-converting hydrogenase Eha subunit C
MAKEIDPLRAKSALAVVKQHPGMVLFLASPGIIAVALVGYFVGAGWAVLLLLALVVGGGAALVLKR